MIHPTGDVNDPHVPPQWAQAVVLESVHCRKCGYDLRGLRADCRCPECGLDIWTSIQHTVDPTASRLPSLRNPRAVGDALLVLTACMLCGTLLLIAPSISDLLNSVAPSGIRWWAAMMPHLGWVSAAVIAAVGLVAIQRLAPPPGSEPLGTVWKDIWRLAIGLLGWLASGAMMHEMTVAPGLTGLRQRLVLHVAIAAFAAIGLLGLRGVLNVIGHRSREYRRSQGGRQSVELIVAAMATGVLAHAVEYFANTGALPRSWAAPADTLIWVSNFMILIGLAYTMMNAWWIRRALRRPPPALDQVLAMQLPPDSWIPDREE